MKLLSSKFLRSATGLRDAPILEEKELVFLGRSNVGKSSLINALAKNKNLAKKSSTPGKTRLINYYEISCKDDLGASFKMIFTDLPGFGYARVSKKEQVAWQKDLDMYLKQRENIALYIHLVDARHMDLDIDLNLHLYIKSIMKEGQEFIRVFTKSDKLNQSQKARLKHRFPAAFLLSVNDEKSLSSFLDLIARRLRA